MTDACLWAEKDDPLEGPDQPPPWMELGAGFLCNCKNMQRPPRSPGYPPQATAWQSSIRAKTGFDEYFLIM